MKPHSKQPLFNIEDYAKSGIIAPNYVTNLSAVYRSNDYRYNIKKLKQGYRNKKAKAILTPPITN